MIIDKISGGGGGITHAEVLSGTFLIVWICLSNSLILFGMIWVYRVQFDCIFLMKMWLYKWHDSSVNSYLDWVGS